MEIFNILQMRQNQESIDCLKIYIRILVIPVNSYSKKKSRTSFVLSPFRQAKPSTMYIKHILVYVIRAGYLKNILCISKLYVLYISNNKTMIKPSDKIFLMA